MKRPFEQMQKLCGEGGKRQKSTEERYEYPVTAFLSDSEIAVFKATFVVPHMEKGCHDFGAFQIRPR